MYSELMNETSRNAKRAKSARRILAAAQEEFAAKGFKDATIRSIADRAGVHASLVMQHYGSKSALFSYAIKRTDNASQTVSDHLFNVLDARMTELPPETRALVRSMLTEPEAENFMRQFLAERVENLKKSFEGDCAELKGTLIVSSILGLTITRHFLNLPAYENIAHDKLVNVANAWFDALASDLGQQGDEETSR